MSATSSSAWCSPTKAASRSRWRSWSRISSRSRLHGSYRKTVPTFADLLQFFHRSSPLRPHSPTRFSGSAQTGEAQMKLIIATAIAALMLAVPARAAERVGPAALGALSGALVLGPVGLVAGAVIG